MHSHRTFALSLAFLGLSGTLSAQNHTETFTGGSNVGGWTYFGLESIPTTGGNPGAYLRSQVDTFAPQARTSDPASPYCGDWRALNVRTIGCDLLTISTQFPADRECSLILTNDNGTPGNPADDCSVYKIHAGHVPQPGEGWRSFDFAIDPQSTTLPGGWGALGNCSGDAAWNSVITSVDQVTFFYGNPEFFFIFDIWEIGLDNPRISTALLPANYCVPKPSSEGCDPVVTWSGLPSASSAAPFVIGASKVLPGALGTLFYGFGASFAAFSGGTLCIQPPVVRLPVQTSGGAGACTGTYANNFNAVIQGGSDPALSVGQTVFVQHWFRDLGAATGTGLTDAGRFQIQP